MEANVFVSKARKVIDKCSYEFYVVNTDQEVKCSCTMMASNQSDPRCPKCLGTGYRIIIRKGKGASGDELKGASTLGARSSRVIKNYFIKDGFVPNEKDLIVDNSEIFYVHRVQRRRSIEGIYSHSEIVAAKLTNAHDEVLNNFNNIINKHRKSK